MIGWVFDVYLTCIGIKVSGIFIPLTVHIATYFISLYLLVMNYAVTKSKKTKDQICSWWS